MNVLTRFARLFGRKPPSAAIDKTADLPGEISGATSERGNRANPDAALQYIYRRMWVDPELRAAIVDLRRMDKLDGRVKKIHARTARAAAKGGLLLRTGESAPRLLREWESYARKLHLYRREKLESDVRGLLMEGNLPMQWIVHEGELVGCARMPAETIVPLVSQSGRFENVSAAYQQWDLTLGQPCATFALWQLTVGRVAPDNYDDWGSLGRPYLDASRTIWQKLTMTEEDLVIRRAHRAPLRMSHILEGASPEQLAEYRAEVEADQAAGNYRDYYSNRKGAVTALQGDANLDQIADVSYLIDGFFAGSPAPKGLFGYVGDLARDVLEDLKRDYYDEIDALQDGAAYVYEQGFRLHLLLRGINPDQYDYTVIFAERRTDTPNQRADHALKLQGLGVSQLTAWEAAGLDTGQEKQRVEREAKDRQVHPEEYLDEPEATDAGVPNVSITPGNGRKGESGTQISTTTSSSTAPP